MLRPRNPGKRYGWCLQIKYDLIWSRFVLYRLASFMIRRGPTDKFGRPTSLGHNTRLRYGLGRIPHHPYLKPSSNTKMTPGETRSKRRVKADKAARREHSTSCKQAPLGCWAARLLRYWATGLLGYWAAARLHKKTEHSGVGVAERRGTGSRIRAKFPLSAGGLNVKICVGK